MMIRKLLAAAICIVFSVFLCAQSCSADVMNAELPERVGISIDVNDAVCKANKAEYAAVVYPGQTEVVLTGTWDGEHLISVSLNGGSSEAEIEYYDDGTWKCSIPVDDLLTAGDNYLEMRYSDDEQARVSCRITLDYECELALHDVYAADNCVSGITEPYAAVKLVCGREEYATAAGSDGSFSFAIDAAAMLAADKCYVMAMDAGGNTACCDVVLKDADIVVSAEVMDEPGCAEVIVIAIPGSSVQLTINGEAWGEPQKIDAGGMARLVVSDLENGGVYEISAVYAGELAGSGEAAEPVILSIDIEGPVITAPDTLIYTSTYGLTIFSDEECVLYVTCGSAAEGFSVPAIAGENYIPITALEGFPSLIAGMKIIITAVDTAGNSELRPVEFTIYADSAQAVDTNLKFGKVNIVDSMEPLVVSGTVYTTEPGCMLDVYLSVDGSLEKLDGDRLTLSEGKYGRNIHFSVELDEDELPKDTDFGLAFDIIRADGIHIYNGGIVYELRAEKDLTRLIPYWILLALSAASFAAALCLYIRLDRRQASLRRMNGTNKRGRRAGRRGRS